MEPQFPIQSLINIAMSFENKTALKLARSEIPLRRIDEVATLRFREWQTEVRKTGDSAGDVETINESHEFELIRLKTLVTWFRSYYNWTTCMECHLCYRPGHLSTTDTEVKFGERVHVEIYHCNECKVQTKFFRFHNPLTLLKTRRGRCAEFAIVFGVMCRSLGFRTRYVHDVSDHAWIEVYSFIEKRWIHVDPCEAVVDRPLLYEQGWGKKLKYIIAAGVDDIQDVTFRYTSNHSEVLQRRSPAFDKQLTNQIVLMRNKLLQRYTTITKNCVLKSVVFELAESLVPPVPMGHYDSRASGFRSWTPPNIYYFIPTDEEIENGSMTIMYSSATDEYRGMRGNFHSWDSHVFVTTNMERVIDNTEGVSYFRKEDSRERGFITWGIDVPKKDLYIEEIKIEANITIVPLLKMTWEVKTAFNDVLASAMNASGLEVILPDGVFKRIFVTVSIIDSKASRIFVEKLDSNGASLCLNVSFKTHQSLPHWYPGGRLMCA